MADCRCTASVEAATASVHLCYPQPRWWPLRTLSRQFSLDLLTNSIYTAIPFWYSGTEEEAAIQSTESMSTIRKLQTSAFDANLVLVGTHGGFRIILMTNL